MNFTLQLSAPSPTPVTVDYATSDGTAQAPSDYLATSGTATFPPGEQSVVVTVQIVGDTIREPNESFTVTLSNPVRAALGAASTARGTIRNDEAD